MLMFSYKHKYNKYKHKYLELKSTKKMVGGNLGTDGIDSLKKEMDELTRFGYHCETDHKYPQK